MHVKQFGAELNETRTFATNFEDIDTIVGVDISKSKLNSLVDPTPVDTRIFKSGTYTIPKGNLGKFNSYISNIHLEY